VLEYVNISLPEMTQSCKYSSTMKSICVLGSLGYQAFDPYPYLKTLSEIFGESNWSFNLLKSFGSILNELKPTGYAMIKLYVSKDMAL